MKKTIFSLYMLLFAAIAVFSPVTANAQTDTPKVYDKCEVMPQFPGGEKAMMDFIATNLKYPQQAIKDNVEGLSSPNLSSIPREKSLSPESSTASHPSATVKLSAS